MSYQNWGRQQLHVPKYLCVTLHFLVLLCFVFCAPSQGRHSSGAKSNRSSKASRQRTHTVESWLFSSPPPPWDEGHPGVGGGGLERSCGGRCWSLKRACVFLCLNSQPESSKEKEVNRTIQTRPGNLELRTVHLCPLSELEKWARAVGLPGWPGHPQNNFHRTRCGASDGEGPEPAPENSLKL